MNTCPREVQDAPGDAENILRREVDIDLPKEETVLLKEPAFIAFSCIVKSLRPNRSWSAL